VVKVAERGAWTGSATRLPSAKPPVALAAAKPHPITELQAGDEPVKAKRTKKAAAPRKKSAAKPDSSATSPDRESEDGSQEV